MSDRLWIAAKAPRPGLAKTRLAADVGGPAALALYRGFLADLAARFASAPFPVGWYVLGDLSAGPVSSAAWYAALAAVAAGAVAAWCVRTPAASARQTADRALLLLLVVMLVSSPTYPWYLVLLAALVPLGSAATAVPAAVVCATAPLLYLQWWLPSGPSWPLDLAWGGGTLALAGALAWRAVPGRRPLRGATA